MIKCPPTRIATALKEYSVVFLYLTKLLTCVVFVFLYQVIFGEGLESVKQNREICSPRSPVFLPDTEMSCGPSEKQLLCKKVSKMFPLTSNI